MKKCNHILCCVATISFITCFIFSLTITNNATSSAKVSVSEDIQDPTPISIQQKEIKSGLERIEKKLQRRRKINAI